MKTMNVMLIKKMNIFKATIFLLFVLISQTLFSQTTITIGTGTTYVTNHPFPRNYNYAWSKQVYLQSEINLSGNITAIAFENNVGTETSWINQSIYMRHVTSSTCSTTRPTSAELSSDWTLVFTGTINFDAAYKTITLSTPFNYNNTDNLEVYYENRRGSNSSNGPQFRETSGANRSVYYRNDDLATFNASTTATGSDDITNIRFTITPNCSNPTASGVIANAQSSCGSFNPSAITSSSPASGETGTLEYKWQHSTTSSVAGFTDIPASNSATYDPTSISQTTWYKRIARVSCKTDWVGAVESNVIEMAVVSPIDLYGNPVSDTIYNQLGNVSFGVGINNPDGVTYQWQVSTNGGGTWANVTNGGVYSGATTSALQVTNPTYAMNTYQYRCVITNACGSINSPAAILTVIPTTTFSNTTTTACGTNMNNDFSFQRTISVSGLPTTLGTASGQYVLKQVNLQLGSSACKGDLSTYRARIISPSGTIIELFNTFTTSTGSMWTNIKYRDHVSLERINQYVMNDQLAYHPHSIGYYAVQTDGSFFSVNGEDPNGNWRLEIAENIATGNEVSFQRVDLIFGPNFTYTDISSSNANDNCANPQCISTQEIVIGTNNAYTSSEPVASFPGLTTDGCGWNGNNNNSAWFNFIASATTANITLSGIVNSTPGGNDTQPIIFSRSGDCTTMGTLTVPVGGCLDDVGDVSSVNLMAYHSSNGGGTSVINNLYSNGISMNAEFQLSGLTVGQTYYLYIDGNGGTPSSFYIEALNGCQTCNTPLPVEWLTFEAVKNNRVSDLYWSTASETNNDYFEVQRSVDTENWEKIGIVAGAGNTSYQMDYIFTDVNPYIGINYYRIKQVDFDGNSSYSDIRAVSFTGEMMLVPNPSNGNFTVVGMPENTSNSLQLINSLGQVISVVEVQSASYSFADLNLASGIYYLTINQQETIKVCVTKSN